MTDKDKLQKLFQAALLDASEERVTLARAYPKSTLDSLAAQAVTPPGPLVAPQPAPEPVTMAPVAAAPVDAPEAPASDLVQPMANAGLDAVSAEELRILLDDQHRRLKSRRRREMVTSLVVFLGITGGGFGWFVSSPERVQAVREAVKEVRSAGDIAGMVAKYQKALDKIATRAQDIDKATESMGVSSSLAGLKDVNMDAEMKEMMGGEGKTVGERNRLLKEKFGSVKEGGLKAALVPASKSEAPAPSKIDNSLSLQH
jgi:hypothetical protein